MFAREEMIDNRKSELVVRRADRNIRPEKRAIINEIRSCLDESLFVVLIDFSGMNVLQINEIRKRLSTVDVQFHVVKNRLFKQAVADERMNKIGQLISGPTAIVIGKGDFIDTAKILKAFNDEFGLLVTRVAVSEERTFSADELDIIVKLPPKHVLQSIFISTVSAPMVRFVGVMQQKLASLLYVLEAIHEKKNQSQ